MPTPSYTPRDDVFHVGASWYPEMWPEEEWEKDVARMHELGFTLMRMYEFAWHRFEPQPGQYDFDWAIKVLDLCHAAGIQVQIGTPTAAPPSWLTDTWPEVLGVTKEGKRKKHGKRKHYNVHSIKYRELGGAIIKKMVEAFADHPALHSWQIDNEMGGYDYGEETLKHFHAWLKKKFTSVDELNKAWGLEFWSQAYTAFEQVPLCTAAVGSVAVPERNHPSLIMAIAEFQNEAWTSFIKEQCDIIRASSDKPIATNMTGMVGGMDWFQHNKVLDRVGASMYADRRYYYYNLPRFDRMRAEKREPYWLMETAPNWSGGGRTFNIHFDHHGPRMFSWLNAFLGGEMVLFWQWREHWAGQEMLHGTCVTATGKWRPGKQGWTQLATEFKEHGPWLHQHPPATADLAIMMSNQASWAFSIDPTDEKMVYNSNFRDAIYMPLAERHLWRDVIHESGDFDRYKVIAAPLMPCIREDAKARLKDWVAEGGTLILGPLSGFRTEAFTAFKDQEFGGLEEIMGADSAVRFTVQWVEDRVGVKFADGHVAQPRTWAEAYAPREGCEVLASYEGGYADGQPAIIKNRYGKGTVITVGVFIDKESWAKVVEEACAEQGITPLAQGNERLIVVPRVDAAGDIKAYAVVNNSEEELTVKLPVGGTDAFSGVSNADGEFTIGEWGYALVKV